MTRAKGKLKSENVKEECTIPAENPESVYDFATQPKEVEQVLSHHYRFKIEKRKRKKCLTLKLVCSGDQSRREFSIKELRDTIHYKVVRKYFLSLPSRVQNHLLHCCHTDVEPYFKDPPLDWD